MAKYQIVVEETIMKTLALEVPDKVSQEELEEWCDTYQEELFYLTSKGTESLDIGLPHSGTVKMDVTLKEEFFDFENYGLRKEASNVK